MTQPYRLALAVLIILVLLTGCAIKAPWDIKPKSYLDYASEAIERRDWEAAPWLYAPRMLPGSDLKLLSGELPDEFLIYEMTADGMSTIDRPHPPGATYFDTCTRGYFDFGLEGCRYLLDAARERALNGENNG